MNEAREYRLLNSGKSDTYSQLIEPHSKLLTIN
jgi:hypothetical protein